MDSLALSRVEHQRLASAQLPRSGVAGLLLRELARTPILGRLLSREPTVLAALPFFALPEALLALVFSLGGLPSTLSVSLTCRTAYAQLWQSPFFWRSLLQAFGASDAELCAAAPEGPACWLKGDGRQSSAKALRDFARHWLLGIDLLAGMLPLASSKSTSKLALCRQGVSSGFDLEDARRAVMAVQVEDGVVLIQRAAKSLANILRNATGEAELVKAETLMEAVAARSDIFTTAQMLDILGAHQEAAEDRQQVHTNAAKQSAQVIRTSEAHCPSENVSLAWQFSETPLYELSEIARFADAT